MHIVYILHSQKLNRFYIGYTTNLDLRLDFHPRSALQISPDFAECKLIITWNIIYKTTFTKM